MTTMVRKRVAELEGAQLDAAVAIAEGLTVRARPGGTYHAKGDSMVPWYSVPRYSVEWVRGGPIIERERIWLAAPIGLRPMWSASVGDDTDCVLGPTPLIAAMRAFVASKLGDEVEVPE